MKNIRTCRVVCECEKERGERWRGGRESGREKKRVGGERPRERNREKERERERATHLGSSSLLALIIPIISSCVFSATDLPQM